MAAVENDEQGAAGRELRDQVSVQGVTVELTLLFIVYWNDCDVETAFSVPVGIFDLATVTAVMEKALGMWFADEPFHGSKHVMAGGVKGSLTVVRQDHHVAFIGRIAS